MKNSAQHGFTLIELLVVISIIAILSVIGLSVYSGVQANARDAIRRTEINNLAKSIETAKDPTAINYTYTDAKFLVDFPTNKPRDPLKKIDKQQYCVATSATATPGDPTAWTLDDVCPTAPATTWYYLVNEAGVYNDGSVGAKPNVLNAGIRYWKVCARLETSGNAFCQGNLQ